MDLASLGISALQNRMDQQKASLEAAIAQVSNGGSGDQQKDMIMLQFQLGQYNAMVETVSNEFSSESILSSFNIDFIICLRIAISGEVVILLFYGGGWRGRAFTYNKRGFLPLLLNFICFRRYFQELLLQLFFRSIFLLKR